MGFGCTLAVLAALAVAAPISAVPIMFTGELNSEDRPLGTSMEMAMGMDAMDAGLSIQAIDVDDLDLLGDHGLTVTNDLTMNLGTMDPPMPFTATSDWSITNNGDIAGYAYLVVVSFDPTPVDVNGMPTEVDYVFSEAGLAIDGFADPNNVQDLAWGFFEVDRTGVEPQALPLYLMMVDLGLIGVGGSVDFDMPYYLTNPTSYLDGSGNNVVLPTLELMSVFTPIPEPGTGVLLALGLGGLGFVGKRRE
jgi:hypothetical protein